MQIAFVEVLVVDVDALRRAIAARDQRLRSLLHRDITLPGRGGQSFQVANQFTPMAKYRMAPLALAGQKVDGSLSRV